MHKINFIFIFICMLFFTSCPSIYFDGLDLINCELDKDTYKINEDIVLNFSGNFDENSGKGYFYIEFSLIKLKNGERDFDVEPSFNIIDSGNLINENDLNNKTFRAHIFNNTQLSRFYEKIIMSISEPGDYELCIGFYASTKKQYRGENEFYALKFKVTE